MYGVGFMLGALALKIENLAFLVIGFGITGGLGIGSVMLHLLFQLPDGFPTNKVL